MPDTTRLPSESGSHDLPPLAEAPLTNGRLAAELQGLHNDIQSVRNAMQDLRDRVERNDVSAERVKERLQRLEIDARLAEGSQRIPAVPQPQVVQPQVVTPTYHPQAWHYPPPAPYGWHMQRAQGGGGELLAKVLSALAALVVLALAQWFSAKQGARSMPTDADAPPVRIRTVDD